MLNPPIRRIAIWILLTGLLLISAAAVAQQTMTGLLRFVHVVPGAPAIDIYSDGQLVIQELAYGEATEYISFSTGMNQLTVTAAGASDPLWQQEVTVSQDRAFTLVASSPTAPTFDLFEDILDSLPVGGTRFTSIHAIADDPAVDVILEDGRPLVVGQAYAQSYGTLDLTVFAYPIYIVPSGEGIDSAVLAPEPLMLNGGTSHMAVAYGTLADPQLMILSAPVNASGDAGAVRLIHAVPDAPAVDIYVNETLIAGLSAPGEGQNASEYINVPPGTYDVTLRVAGTQQSVLSTTLDVAASTRTTALAVSDGDAIGLSLLDDSQDVTATDAMIRIINISGDPITVNLEDGTLMAEDLASGEAGNIVSVPATNQAMDFTFADQTAVAWAPRTYYGGVLYNVLVTGNAVEDILLLDPVSLAQSTVSAPGASDAPVVAQVPTATPAPVEVQPTVPPPTVAPAAPPALPADAIIGRVFNLNPDANLQLREYPSTEARSLGVLPPNTTVIVNGREGAIEAILRSATPVPADYEYVDPVGLLAENEDLPRDQTWLNITYTAADGGQLTAWARSDFVDVRAANGQPVALRDLPTVPGNEPGESSTTSITAPTAPRDIVTAVVINLSPSANLNLRRTPDSNGEILAQLPLNTVTTFGGVNLEGDWTFVTYNAPDGSAVTGWASSGFLQYQLNGNLTTLEELEVRGLLTITPDDTRGSVTTGAGVIVAPTIDPIRDSIVAEVALDPGANLNLRRNPNNVAEVLAPIPSGTRLVVTERTGDANWLRVTYEGREGWIAARLGEAVFVRLSFNGTPFELLDVPLAADEIDSARFTPTPTLPPTPTDTPEG